MTEKHTVVVSTRYDPDALAALKKETGIKNNARLLALSLDFFRAFRSWRPDRVEETADHIIADVLDERLDDEGEW